MHLRVCQKIAIDNFLIDLLKEIIRPVRSSGKPPQTIFIFAAIIACLWASVDLPSANRDAIFASSEWLTAPSGSPSLYRSTAARCLLAATRWCFAASRCASRAMLCNFPLTDKPSHFHRDSSIPPSFAKSSPTLPKRAIKPFYYKSATLFVENGVTSCYPRGNGEISPI